MSSRFFRGASSESESESSLEEYSSSENEEQQQQQQQAPAARSAFSRFLQSDDESDDDGGKRVVKSAKDKLFEDFKSFTKEIDSSRDDDDWATVQSEYEKLIKSVGRGQTILKKNGYPHFLLKCLCEVEDAVLELHEDKEAKKRLSGVHAKAVTALKQKFRKLSQDLLSAMSKWRSDPSAAHAADAEELTEESEAEVAAPVAVKSKPSSRFFHSMASSGSEEEESSDEEESESSSDAETDSSIDYQAQSSANRWKKAAATSNKSTAIAVSTKVAAKKEVAAAAADAKGVSFASGTDEKSGAAAVDETKEITVENLYTKLKEIQEARGKKGTDKGEQIVVLEKLLQISETPIQKARVLMSLISARFDFNMTISACQTPEMWKSTEREIGTLFEIIVANSDIVFDETIDDLDDENLNDNAPIKYIRGNVVSLISRLDDEFTKSLQSIDNHSSDYVERLKDEFGLYTLILRAENYCQSKADEKSLTHLRILRLEHIYYKYNDVILKIEDAVRQQTPALSGHQVKDSDVLVHDLCVYLYQKASDRIRTRAILCHVYHHALNKRYEEARDLLLMSHLQESIAKADVPTQVLYNRALAQIGICAFKKGMIKECHHSLNEIMATLKTKDILAQGTQLSRYQLADADKKDKQKLLPFHMHINLELLEAIQFTVSMLLEIPSIALNVYDSRKKVISKHFRRLLDFSARQPFVGPPENFKDSIMQGAKALTDGNWKKCAQLICNEKVWDYLPEQKEISLMLREKIKEYGLKTYLLNFGKLYENVGLSQLAEMFEMSTEKVISIVSEMITRNELRGSVDLKTDVVTLQQMDMSRLQFSLQQFTDRATLLIDGNEKLYETLFVRETKGPRNPYHQSQKNNNNNNYNVEKSKSRAS